MKKNREQYPSVSIPCAFGIKTWAGKYVELSERSLWEAVKKGEIDVVECGRRRLITAEAMDCYFKRHTKMGFDVQTEVKQFLEEKSKENTNKKRSTNG